MFLKRFIYINKNISKKMKFLQTIDLELGWLNESVNLDKRK